MSPPALGDVRLDKEVVEGEQLGLAAVCHSPLSALASPKTQNEWSSLRLIQLTVYSDTEVLSSLS